MDLKLLTTAGAVEISPLPSNEYLPVPPLPYSYRRSVAVNGCWDRRDRACHYKVRAASFMQVPRHDKHLHFCGWRGVASSTVEELGNESTSDSEV